MVQQNRLLKCQTQEKDYDTLIKNFKITCNEVLAELNDAINNLEPQKNL